MRSITLVSLDAIVLIVLAPLGIQNQLAAQDKHDEHNWHHHYQLIDVGTFGGPSSYFDALYVGPFFSSAHVMNNKGTFAGWADISQPDPFPNLCFDFTLGDCSAAHAFRYEAGFMTDLGVLAEGWSSAGLWINDASDIVGIAQDGVVDPLTGVPEQRAVLWQHGQIRDLGTLGGNMSAALSINNRGQVAGLALNEIADPFSIYDLLNFNSPSGTQTRAVLWDENGKARDLGTLGGSDAYAAFVNDRGQVAGWSYTNSTVNATTGLPTFHPFLWERGKGMRDLGTLGGTVAQAVNGLNNHGQVVGATTITGDQNHHPFLWDGQRLIDLGTFGGDNGEAAWINDDGDVVGTAQPKNSCTTGPGGGHAFLWHHGRLQDLGTTAGLDNSEADYINSRGQVVGYSFTCDFSAFDAFLWEDGSIVDLNALIPSNSGFYLWAAEFIADKGEIAALGLLPNGHQHVVLLIPCDDDHPGVEGCDYSMVDPATAPHFQVPNVNSPERQWISPWRHLAQDIDDRGEIPGPSAADSGGNHAFLHAMQIRQPNPFMNRLHAAAYAGSDSLARSRVDNEVDSMRSRSTATLKITSGLPANGRVGRLYDVRCSQLPGCTPFLIGFSVTAAGGKQPYSWAWEAQPGSSLPPGLFFPSYISSECTVPRPAICGKPTKAGSYNIVVTVRDSESPPHQASQKYTIDIFPK